MSVCAVFACVYTCIYKCTHLHVCIRQLDITLSCLPWLISIIYSFLETKVEHEPLRSAILAVQQWGIHMKIYDFHGLQNNSLCFYCFVAGKTNESDSPPSFTKETFSWRTIKLFIRLLFHAYMCFLFSLFLPWTLFCTFRHLCHPERNCNVNQTDIYCCGCTVVNINLRSSFIHFLVILVKCKHSKYETCKVVPFPAPALWSFSLGMDTLCSGSKDLL